MSIASESIFKNFVLSDCQTAKLHSRMLVVVLRRFFHVEKKIDKPAQIQALDGMKKKQRTFPVKILDVIQKVELVCRSENTNSLNQPENTSLMSILQNVSYT